MFLLHCLVLDDQDYVIFHPHIHAHIPRTCTSSTHTVHAHYLPPTHIAIIPGTFHDCPRCQVYARDVRDEYVRHFLHGECVTGREYEARLSKTLLPRITERDVTGRGQLYQTTNSCVIKVVSHNR
jgi:hypothetical protein